jgi:hypothetical protein
VNFLFPQGKKLLVDRKKKLKIGMGSFIFISIFQIRVGGFVNRNFKKCWPYGKGSI